MLKVNRLITAILIVVLSLALASCNGQKQETENSVSSPAETSVSSVIVSGTSKESSSATSTTTAATTSETEAGDNIWRLTQYSDTTGSQAIFYTVSRNGADDLIVIDGGTEGNADYVRTVINDLGGEVDAWILTHPHPDHIGAFTVIYENPEGIDITAVYDNGLDYEYFEPVAFDWDGIEGYEKYLMLTEGDPRIMHPERGAVFEVDGLEIEVFNTYDEVLLDYYLADVCNESSLVFKINFEKDSVLFAGDCYSAANSEYLINTYGDRLKADYVQMGHHGNATLSDAFYALVDPEIALFDAPDWLMDSETYTTKIAKAYMESIGSTVYYYVTAPNEFELK